MLVLFDHSTPAPLAPHIVGHMVGEAKDRGWDTLSNGELLAEAERAGFEVLLTADTGMAYQQNLKGRRIVIVILTGNRGNARTSGTKSQARMKKRDSHGCALLGDALEPDICPV